MAGLGVCYGARRINQPTEKSVDDDMKLIKASGFSPVRTYGVSGTDQWNIAMATKHGLEIAIGVWIQSAGKSSETERQIKAALSQAEKAREQYQPGFPLTGDLVIGNEVNRPERNIPPGEILAAMKYAKNAMSINLKFNVTTCFSGTVLGVKDLKSKWGPADWIPVVEACDRPVYLTVYPWYGQQTIKKFSPKNIDDQMEWSLENGLSQVEKMGKKIIIAEIGWPSWRSNDDKRPGTAIDDERDNLIATENYLLKGLDSKNQKTILGPRPAFWFAMFDEPWKTDKPWESHWGLFTGGPSPMRKWPWK